MIASKTEKSIKVQNHWYVELGKVRCWLEGFHAARGDKLYIPGEDVLRQIQIAIMHGDDTRIESEEHQQDGDE